jgi:proteasome accessory factor B
MPRQSPSQVKKEDRLFSLILALLSSREGLTKNQIMRTVRGYSDIYTIDANDALDKMFERDKQELRSMGVVIDTIELPEELGQTHNIRYSISHRNFDLPEDFTVSPQELTLLNIAAKAWAEGSLSSDSRHALTKLNSLGLTPDTDLVGVAPRISTRDPAFEKITEALEHSQIVTFSYLKPGDEHSRERTVAPLAVLQWNGYWHMLAFDLDVEAERTFLLSRMVTIPQKIPQKSHDYPEANYAQRLLDELVALQDKASAVVSVSPETDAWIRLKDKATSISGEEMTFTFTDLYLFAQEIIPFGEQIKVVSPPELRDIMIENFRRMSSPVGGQN